MVHNLTCLCIESSVIPSLTGNAVSDVFESRDLIADFLEQPEVSWVIYTLS